MSSVVVSFPLYFYGKRFEYREMIKDDEIIYFNFVINNPMENFILYSIYMRRTLIIEVDKVILVYCDGRKIWLTLISLSVRKKKLRQL